MALLQIFMQVLQIGGKVCPQAIFIIVGLGRPKAGRELTLRGVEADLTFPPRDLSYI